MRLNDRPDDRQAQAHAAARVIVVRIAAEKRLEHVLLLLLRNSRPVIVNRYDEAIRRLLQSRRHAGIEFRRIVDQVDERPLQRLRPA